MDKYEYVAFKTDVSTQDGGFGYYLRYPITPEWEFVCLTMLNNQMDMIFRRVVQDRNNLWGGVS